MPRTRHKPRRSRLHAHWAGFSRVALTLGPVLLLAVIGILGLRESRRAARENARIEVLRGLELLLANLEERLSEVRRDAPAPRLYPAIPEPAAPNEAQELYAKALAAAPENALPLLAKIETESPNSPAPSGLPLLPLVKWAECSRQPADGQFPERVESLGQVAVISHPSILTPFLLEQAGALAGRDAVLQSIVKKWNRRWLSDEAARAILEEEHALAPAAIVPRWADRTEDSWWLENDLTRGDVRLVSESRLRLRCADLLLKMREAFPTFASLSVRFHGKLLSAAPSPGEPLASLDDANFELRAVIFRPDWLYAQQRRQLAWLSALLGASVVSAAAGFWMMNRALDREQQLNAMKSNFVASVTHELRAPIASMRIMAENLNSGFVAPVSKQNEYHRMISEECRRLAVLIENVLDLARIEQDRKSYTVAETDVALLIQDTAALMQPAADKKRQLIVLEIGALDQAPVCDGLAVQRALTNLLDNAVKFSPAGQTIRLGLAQNGSASWDLSVTDCGPGIPAAEQKKIFERFYRTGSELRRETEGAGIGLSIVWHIAAGHGGSVRVESPANGGSRFTLSLPFQPPANPPMR